MRQSHKKDYEGMENHVLVEKCKENDTIALEILLKRHERIIYNTLYHLDPCRMDTNDLVQEVLYKIARNVKNIRNPKTFKYWVNQIIMNLFYDTLRKKTRTIKTISIDSPIVNKDKEDIFPGIDVPDTAQKPCESTLASELDVVIKKAIAELPEQFKTVIVLRELQGLSYEDIASLTGTNIGTVKSRLARARSKLQQLIKPYIN